MKPWLKVALTITGNLAVVAFATLAVVTRSQAQRITASTKNRTPPSSSGGSSIS